MNINSLTTLLDDDAIAGPQLSKKHEPDHEHVSGVKDPHPECTQDPDIAFGKILPGKLKNHNKINYKLNDEITCFTTSA